MKNKIIITTTIATLASLTMSGCGSSNTTESGTIPITALCSADASTYHTLLKGDVIEKYSNTLLPESSGATPEYKILMNGDGTKTVCKISGDAAIIRS